MATMSFPPVFVPFSPSLALQEQLNINNSFVINSWKNALENASPISRKEHFKCALCELNSHCSNQHYHRKKGPFSGAPRKLEFPNEKSTDENKSNDNTSKETNKDFSITEFLKCFPTEKNCNEINDVKNTNPSNDSSNRSYLFDSESEDAEASYILFDYLENVNKSSDSNHHLRHKGFNPLSFDLLHELKEINCFSILSCILSFISDEEVRKVSNVCKEWRYIVSSDKNANERLKAYIKRKKNLATGSQKENKTSKKTPERGHKSAFLTLTNSPVEITPQPLHHSHSPGRFDYFIEEAQKLQKEKVMIKCPKCCYPSRAESENKHCCSRMLCQHIFCSICLSPRQDQHVCSVPKLNSALPSIKIGGKQSKRNLRRL